MKTRKNLSLAPSSGRSKITVLKDAYNSLFFLTRPALKGNFFTNTSPTLGKDSGPFQLPLAPHVGERKHPPQVHSSIQCRKRFPSASVPPQSINAAATGLGARLNHPQRKPKKQRRQARTLSARTSDTQPQQTSTTAPPFPSRRTNPPVKGPSYPALHVWFSGGQFQGRNTDLDRQGSMEPGSDKAESLER